MTGPGDIWARTITVRVKFHRRSLNLNLVEQFIWLWFTVNSSPFKFAENGNEMAAVGILDGFRPRRRCIASRADDLERGCFYRLLKLISSLEDRKVREKFTIAWNLVANQVFRIGIRRSSFLR